MKEDQGLGEKCSRNTGYIMCTVVHTECIFAGGLKNRVARHGTHESGTQQGIQVMFCEHNSDPVGSTKCKDIY